MNKLFLEIGEPAYPGTVYLFEQLGLIRYGFDLHLKNTSDF